jgi:hypothetical protein
MVAIPDKILSLGNDQVSVKTILMPLQQTGFLTAEVAEIAKNTL